jgi:hypothetical protein
MERTSPGGRTCSTLPAFGGIQFAKSRELAPRTWVIFQVHTPERVSTESRASVSDGSLRRDRVAFTRQGMCQ